MPDEVAVVEEPVETPEVDPLDELRGMMFGSEEERASILAKSEEPTGEPTPEAKPEAAAKPKSKPKPKAALEETPEPEPEPEPTKPKPPKKLTTEELIRLNADASREAVVAGVREAVEQTSRRAQPEPEKPATLSAERANLPASIKKNLQALRILAETKPDEFKDIETKAVKFWDEKTGDLAKYRKAWQKDHPDDEFDMDADEHSDWMKDNEPYVSEDDLEMAKEEALRRKLRNEVQSEMEPLRRRIAERDAEEQAAPVIVKSVNSSLKNIVSEINPELKDLSEEDIGNNLHSKDPLAAHVLVRTAPTFVPLISETIRIFAGKPYDPNNQVHAQLDRYASGLERSFAGMTPEQSVINTANGPLRFATRAQIARMSQADRVRFWTVNREVILDSLRRDWSNETSKSYKEYKTLLEAVGAKSAPVANPTPAPKKQAAAPVEEPAEEPEVTPRSPTVRSASPAPPPVPSDDPSLRKSGQSFFDRAGW